MSSLISLSIISISLKSFYNLFKKSHLPLLTDTFLPAWQVKPPLERKYGGSANIISTEFSGILGRILKQSSRSKTMPCLLSSKYGFVSTSLSKIKNVFLMYLLLGYCKHLTLLLTVFIIFFILSSPFLIVNTTIIPVI